MSNTQENKHAAGSCPIISGAAPLHVRAGIFTTINRNIALGFENLVNHKLRSFLTVLGMIFGVASVISMLSVGEGASRDALDQIRKLGSRNIIITSRKSIEETTDQKTFKFTSVYGLLYNDAIRLRETFPTIQNVVPVKALKMQASAEGPMHEIRLVGTTPDWFNLVRRQLLAGRIFTTEDMDTRRNAVVLTEALARQLLAARNSTGQILRIGGNSFEVVGIVQNADSGGSIQTPDSPLDAYIPISVARERFGDIFVQRAAGNWVRERVELHKIIVQVDKLENVRPTARAICRMLARFHRHIDYEIQVPLALLEQAARTKRTFNIVLGAIACISLLVGGTGIMNIMLASVTERTREIGIRRAIGATRRQIIEQFLFETMVLSIIGGLSGVALGVLIPRLVTHFTGMPTVTTPGSVLMSLGISAAIGLIFGIYPAFSAAKLDPIAALRHE